MLTIGKLQFDTNLLQGPLAGYSCAPFRALVHRFGHVAFCCTEMISAKHIARNSQMRRRYLLKSPNEGKVCYQISGNDPQDIRHTVQIVEQAGADLIDLNCGCPMQKIRKKGCGSALVDKPKTLAACIRAMRESTALPISIKIRVDSDQSHLQALSIAEQEGVDFITVHGRHWSESYDVACRYDQIAEVVQCASVPVIGNGDVSDLMSLQAMQSYTHCNGIMISRAAVGQPWLFAQLHAQQTGLAFVRPAVSQIGTLFVTHIEGLVALESEKIALLQSRKLAKYYGKHLPEDRQLTFITQAKTLSTLVELQDLVGAIFR